MDWPNNADGDVFRRLDEQGFDFSGPHWVDFNIDFDNWPPDPALAGLIQEAFPKATIVNEDGDDRGYMLIQLFACLDYDFVIRTQAELSRIAEPFGGACESWGVPS